VTILDDEFDLDVRLTLVRDRLRVGDLVGRGGLDLPLGQTDADTVAPAQTCPEDTCELGCQTMTCPEETCGCNTAETCDQQLEDCGGGFTLGQGFGRCLGGRYRSRSCSAAASAASSPPPAAARVAISTRALRLRWT